MTAALLIAYALTGFAVLHTLTLALKNRALWLGCTYAIVAVFAWPFSRSFCSGLPTPSSGFASVTCAADRRRFPRPETCNSTP